jgi:hypothetical protein
MDDLRSRIWSYSTSTPQYVFMAWCLGKHRDNFAFTFNSVCVKWDLGGIVVSESHSLRFKKLNSFLERHNLNQTASS